MSEIRVATLACDHLIDECTTCDMTFSNPDGFTAERLRSVAHSRGWTSEANDDWELARDFCPDHSRRRKQLAETLQLRQELST